MSKSTPVTPRDVLPIRNGRPKTPTLTCTAIVDKLRSLQRQRTVVMKSRIMQANRLRSVVACHLGYDNDMAESDRTKKYDEAQELIESVDSGGSEDFVFRGIIQATMIGIHAFLDQQEGFETDMIKLVKQLPIYKWQQQKEQTGFGTTSLAVLIGELGDLNNYSGPAKVWRRMGCAPWQYGDKTLMGATWRSGKEGKLPSEEWDKFAYCPRRRAIMYVIGEGLLKQNLKTDKEAGKVIWCGPYRRKYDEAKAAAIQNHPDWTACACKGTGKTTRGGKCPECAGKGVKLKRCHLHGMLVASKLLLKHLWQQWRKT